jgi:pyruvate kinase
VALAVTQLADGTGARLIGTITATGASPRRVARFRTETPAVASGGEPRVLRELLLSYGTYPLMLRERPQSFDDWTRMLTSRLKELGAVRTGDVIVIAGGKPPFPPGGTNLVEVHTVC